jgi:hypothetical protein
MAYTTDAKTIIDTASAALNDVGVLTWFAEELLTWLNLSQIEMVNLAPRTNIKSLPVQLVAGIKQSLPADGIVLADIPYNRGAAGATIGATINAVPKLVMNKRVPGWTTAAANAVVKHYIYDPNTPKEFYVYPAQTSSPTYVEMAYAAVPTVIANANEGTKITVDDEYQNVLLNLVLSKALTKYVAVPGNDIKAAAYRDMAELELGIRTQPKQQASDPASNTPAKR